MPGRVMLPARRMGVITYNPGVACTWAALNKAHVFVACVPAPKCASDAPRRALACCVNTRSLNPAYWACSNKPRFMSVGQSLTY